MKTFEIIWEIFWFAAFALFIGSLYGLVTSPIILYFFPQVNVMIVSTGISIIFLTACFYFENMIINAAVGILYIIAGFIIGGFLTFRLVKFGVDPSVLMMLGVGLSLFIVIVYQHFGSNRQRPAMLTLFGYISSNFTILIYGKIF